MLMLVRRKSFIKLCLLSFVDAKFNGRGSQNENELTKLAESILRWKWEFDGETWYFTGFNEADNTYRFQSNSTQIASCFDLIPFQFDFSCQKDAFKKV